MVENTDTSKWYVVHCHSGFEKKVADSILDEAKKVNLEDSISEVSVPTQAVVEVRRGVRVNSEKKFFPGYVLIKMIMNDDTWHLVRDIPKVSNFLGTKDKPIAISEREVSKLLPLALVRGFILSSVAPIKSGSVFPLLGPLPAGYGKSDEAPPGSSDGSCI